MCNRFRAALVGCLFFMFSYLSNSQTQANMTLPTLHGGYPYIGVRTMSFTDAARLDDLAPQSQPREVIVSLFYPSGEHAHSQDRPPTPRTRYMPDAMAEFYDSYLIRFGARPGVMQHLYTDSQTNAPAYTTGGRPFPLLVFSPGHNITFRLYTAILEEIARLGYVVAAIDHPYDAAIVEFPDGKVVRGAADLDLGKALAARVQDITFVLNELSEAAPSHPFPIDTDQVVAFGHSLGGDAAVEVMLNDLRVAGAVNFDGGFYGNLVSSHRTISRPTLFFRNSANVLGHDWNRAFDQLIGWKAEIEVLGTNHLSFTDLSILVDALGMRNAANRGLLGPPNVGGIWGLLILDIMSSFVAEFAKFVDDTEGDLHIRLPERFPEARRLRSDVPSVFANDRLHNDRLREGGGCEGCNH